MIKIKFGIFGITTLLFLSFVCPQDSKLVEKTSYSICYSEKYKNPLRAEYKLYKPFHSTNRDGMNFKKEDGIATATNKDFENNPYDKGHLVPAEDFSNDSLKMLETFSYTNCAVQHYKLNRGTWKILESQVRNWAQKDSLLIIVEVVFNKNPIQLPTGAFIPNKFKKTIIFLTTREKRSFIFPNEQCDNNIYFYELE